MNRRLLIVLTFALLGQALHIQAKVTLGFKGENSALVGIYVKDIDSGEVLASNDEEKAMMPASVMKTVTAATALTILPQDFTFETPVWLSGNIANGVCDGNLVIDSDADPTIDSGLFKDRRQFASEIADALADMGVKQIKGRIIVRQTLPDAGYIPQWQIDDRTQEYGVGLYGFNYRDNWTGKAVMTDPAKNFTTQLKSVLTKRGITLSGLKTASDKKTTVMTHNSAPLADILKALLVNSHNLFAEGILRAIVPGGTRQQAINKELEVWTARDIGAVQYNKILDGSGLARVNRTRPIFIANMLEWMAASDYADAFAGMLPAVGKEGTVKNLLKDTRLAGKLRLKSGSVNAVQCFAGYKIDDNGRPTHVVVIFVNNFYCDRPSVRKSIEQFLLKTF